MTTAIMIIGIFFSYLIFRIIGKVLLRSKFSKFIFLSVYLIFLVWWVHGWIWAGHTVENNSNIRPALITKVNRDTGFLEFTIKNFSPYHIRDLEINCIFIHEEYPSRIRLREMEGFSLPFNITLQPGEIKTLRSLTNSFKATPVKRCFISKVSE